MSTKEPTINSITTPAHSNKRPSQSSPLVRAALLAYVCLIVYASWYPFAGWRDLGTSPLAYLTLPLPRYWTFFDVGINVVGYIPYGALLVLAVYPWVARLWAMLLAATLGILTTGLMEAVQTFLPSRVSSNLDLLTNSLGVLIGVIIGGLLTPRLLERDLLQQILQRWFVPHVRGLNSVSSGVVLVCLWPLAQIFPLSYHLGLGQILPTFSRWLDVYLGIPIDLGEVIRQGYVFSVQQYWLAETLLSCFGMASAGLLLLCLLQKNAPKGRLMGLLIAANISIKSLAMALLFTPDNAYSWATPSAQAGMLLGAILLYGLLYTPPKVQRHLACYMLAASLVIVNFVPDNPYFADMLSTWVQGKFLNFNGAAQFLSVTWPWVTLWFLLHYHLPKNTDE